MSCWSELRKKKRTCVISFCRGGRIQLCLLYPDDENPHYDVYARQWVKDEQPVFERFSPEGWVDLWPRERIFANSWAAARELQLGLGQKMEANFPETDFEVRASSLERIDIVTHPKGPEHARIYRHHDGRYEIRYDTFPPRQGGWIPAGYEVCTFADSLDEARMVAYLELEQIVAL